MSAVEIAPLLASDLADIELQASQAHMRAFMGADFGLAIQNTETCATALHNGAPVACAGICDIEGRRYAWAFLGAYARPVMLAATRVCRDMVARETSDVFTHVDTRHAANVRWIKLLGFKPTGTIDRMPDGTDCELWVKRHVD